jgi:PST family polysaccharide transporter
MLIRVGKGMKTMFTNFVSLVLLQGVNYILPLLTYPFLFRVLGVEKWGMVSFGYAVILYLSMITEFGFSLSATKFISENRVILRR